MLPVSLDCLFLTAPSVFSNVYLFRVLCAQCYQCLWIVHSWPPLQFSPTFICPVSCVSNVASVSGLSIFYFPQEWTIQRHWQDKTEGEVKNGNPETLATLDTQETGQINVRENWRGSQEWTIQRHWQEKTKGEVKNGQSRDTGNIGQTRHRTNKRRRKLKGRDDSICPSTSRIVHSWLLSNRVSLTFICPVPCVPNVVSVFKLSIIYCPFGFLLPVYIKMIFYLFIYWVK
jgi:hypothetical protein